MNSFLFFLFLGIDRRIHILIFTLGYEKAPYPYHFIFRRLNNFSH